MTAPKLCADCGTEPDRLIRERCSRCYWKLRKALKKAGTFTKLDRFRPLLDRLLDKAVAGPDGCLIWTGSTNKKGYGSVGKGKHGRLLVHRAAYELMVGPIPDGAQIDHTCHNRDRKCPGGRECLHRRCVNPHHLEAVTPRENLLRSPNTLTSANARKTHCAAGHEFDEANTRHDPRRGRRCRECDRDRARDAFHAARMAIVPCGQLGTYSLRPCTRPAGHEGSHNCKRAIPEVASTTEVTW